VLVVLLLVDGFIFLVTLIPPLFNWKNKKVDSRKRIFFAAFACLTFYFWLAVLAVQSLYCFGFWAHEGPCQNKTSQLSQDSGQLSAGGDGLTAGETPTQQVGGNVTDSEAVNNSSSNINTSAMSSRLVDNGAACIYENKNALKNVTLVNFLIVIVLIIVIAANINEVMNAKALYTQETLCKRDEVQRFLSSLLTKRPEVGHFVKCFHQSKSPDTKTVGHKVVTYSTIENFEYQTWKDFSDMRLIEPTKDFPVIEVEIVLNFFPGDHVTADKYKAFVQRLTKENSGKDQRISIDDYFHIEDQREWTFFVGNKRYIVPWWQKDPARIFLSCVILFGWPFRLSYKGKIAKHKIEVKKAVFCENTSQDEGVSLTATPGSSTDGNNSQCKQEVEQALSPTTPTRNNHEHVVDVQVSSPPPVSVPHTISPLQRQYPPDSPDRSTPLLNRHHGPEANPPLRAAPMASPRTHLRETTKDIVTAVTHHDINGMNAVSTVALKDIDVQMSALSGYETYV
jgi:hypothetical protein